MADTKISALSSATSIAGNEDIPIVQSGNNLKVTPQLVQTQVYTERTVDFSLAPTDSNRDQHINSASPIVATIEANATVALPVGFRVDFIRLGSGSATIDAVSGVTLNGVDGDSIAIDARYVWVRLKKVGADAWNCSLVEGRTFTPATHGSEHAAAGGDPLSGLSSSQMPNGSIITVSGTTRTMADSDSGQIIRVTNASGCTVTFPDSLTPGKGGQILQAVGAGSVEWAVSGSMVATPSGDSRSAHTASNGEGSYVTWFVDATNSVIIGGDTA